MHQPQQNCPQQRQSFNVEVLPYRWQERALNQEDEGEPGDEEKDNYSSAWTDCSLSHSEAYEMQFNASNVDLADKYAPDQGMTNRGALGKWGANHAADFGTDCAPNQLADHTPDLAVFQTVATGPDRADPTDPAQSPDPRPGDGGARPHPGAAVPGAARPRAGRARTSEATGVATLV